jgi:2-polyprenyl-3-methyl-5-hydroxy-6-metoxy-1,4-benzoquinol methylase
MNDVERKNHWENIYQTKQLNEVSWYQPTPQTSLNFFKELTIDKTANIIDIGGGDSFLVDNLLQQGYQNITVLDIALHAIERAKKRLGSLAAKVKWIETDIINFKPTEKYDFWHDRAAFHFLTSANDINAYIQIAQESINPNGIMVIGTFSNDGPLKCSGINIQQYSAQSLSALFSHSFTTIQSFTTNHLTPFNTQQNFLFCSFRKLSSAINK